MPLIAVQLKDGPAKSIAAVRPDLTQLRALQGSAEPVFGIIIAAATGMLTFDR